jgi:hypothetical protein
LRKDLLEPALTVLEKKILKEFAIFTGFWPKYDLEMKVQVKSQT